MMVTVAGLIELAPAPEAVALFVIWATAISFCVMVYIAVQLTVWFVANVVVATPQLIGVVM